MTATTIPEQIECLQHEIERREENYPRWVNAGTMDRDVANREIAAMHAALITLLSASRLHAAAIALDEYALNAVQLPDAYYFPFRRALELYGADDE